MHSRFAGFLSCVMMAGLLAGCGAKSDRLPVHGQITLDGAPLPTGTIAFTGPDGSAVAAGNIQDGKYTVSESGSRRGIPPGTYNILITSWLETPGEELPGGGFSKGKSAIPEKYSNPKTSGFTADIQPDKVEFNYELTSK